MDYNINPKFGIRLNKFNLNCQFKYTFYNQFCEGGDESLDAFYQCPSFCQPSLL